MTDAPERIWATGNTNTGCWNDTSVAHHGVSEVEYVRADLARAAPTVKPLTFEEAVSIVEDTEDAEMTEEGDRRWTRRMAEPLMKAANDRILSALENNV